MTNSRVQLSANTTFQCVEILLIDDTIVEIEEVFQIQVEQVVSSDDLVFGLNPEFAEVFIMDNDGNVCLLTLGAHAQRGLQ